MLNIKRFYCKDDLVSGNEVRLEDDRAHYVRNVLRIKAGEQIHCFNESSGEFVATVTTVSKKSVVIQVEEKIESIKEPLINIHLGQAISRGERMDYVVQKATELGVTTITPLYSQRCNIRLNAERAETRTQHWQQIAMSACEQSGRINVPKINLPITLDAWLNERKEESLFICDPDIENECNDIKSAQDIAVLIGPEGGFTKYEISDARNKNFKNINLGPRILRTETATVVALSILQLKWGDI